MAVLENLTKSTIVLVFKYVEDADKMDKLMDRQALLQDKIDALGAWEIDTKLEIAMDALRTPDADTPIKNLSGGTSSRGFVPHFSNLMFYYWMSLPITWMQKAYCG
jgi:ATPase subunit of ABC transporter with duplicated ATPase domains